MKTSLFTDLLFNKKIVECVNDGKNRKRLMIACALVWLIFGEKNRTSGERLDEKRHSVVTG